MANSWNGYLRRSFLEFQVCVVPRAADFTPAQREKSLELAVNALAGKPSHWKWKIFAFFVLLDLVKFLSPLEMGDVLRLFFNSPVPVLRKGFWGLNTLAKLGVYGQDSVYESLHYVPNREK